MKTIFVLIALCFIIACSSSKKIITGSRDYIDLDTSAIKSGDGSSFENAIVINETRSTVGISKEYQWLRENYPGYQLLSQGTRREKGRQYDILTFRTADGTLKIIYFDISKFYGRF